MTISNRLNTPPIRDWHIPQPAPITRWEQIIAIEPRLERVIDEARRRRGRDGNPWRSYEELKRILSRHVGRDASIGRLRSDEAYNVAIARLTETLGV